MPDPDPDFAERGLLICGSECAMIRALEREATARGARVEILLHGSVGDRGGTALESSEEDAVDDAFDDACERLGRIDGLAVLQGPAAPEPFLESTPAGWWDAVTWNLRLPFLLDRRAIEEFLAAGEGGSLLHVAPRLPADASGLAKAAACGEGVSALSRTFMKEVGRREIRSNTVRVDPLWLEPGDAGDSPEVRAVAAGALFFLSEAASFVTGNDVVLGRP